MGTWASEAPADIWRLTWASHHWCLASNIVLVSIGFHTKCLGYIITTLHHDAVLMACIITLHQNPYFLLILYKYAFSVDSPVGHFHWLPNFPLPSSSSSFMTNHQVSTVLKFESEYKISTLRHYSHGCTGTKSCLLVIIQNEAVYLIQWNLSITTT